MYRKFLSLIFSCILLNVNSQTSVSGGTVAGTWHLSGSPYQVQGSIMVPNDSVLTIDPGVRVEFNGMYKLVVLGSLKAIGTVSDTIVFAAVNTTNGWRGIRFSNTTANNDSSVIKYCRVTYGKATGGAPDNCGGAFYLNGFSKVRVDHCLLSLCTSNSFGGAVFLNNSNALISNNTVSYNTTVSDGAGAIYASNSSPVIISNNINNNVAHGGGGGGGILCSGGSPSITSNTISSNQIIGASGGGIYSSNSSISIKNNIIDGNSSQNNDAGGILCTGGVNIKILNNIIRNNSTPGGGGGLACSAVSSALIDGNTIHNNISTDISSTVSSGGGAGIYTFGNNIAISNNYIFNNNTLSCGGGIYCNQGSPTFINNVICNNTATLGGAFFYMSGPNPVINNNTISNNSANKGGAIYCYGGSNPTFNNTILWGNSSTIGGNQVYLEDEASDPTFKNCNIEGGTGAFDPNGNFYTGIYTNNINNNPSYVNPSAGSGTGFNGQVADWSLLSTSPCIDAGYLTGAELPNDIAGNTRVTGTTIDIGAFEQSTTTGIKDQKDAYSVKIYPNPATDFIIIESDQLAKDQKNLVMYDIHGQKVKSLSNISEKSVKIYRENLPAGIYFIQITSTGKHIATEKIIITDN